MRSRFFAASLCGLGVVLAQAQPVSVLAGEAEPVSATATRVASPPKAIGGHDAVEVKKIVDAITAKLAKIKGYRAKVELQALDPNGGFDKFENELTVRLPDRMMIKQKILMIHDSGMRGAKVVIAIDGTWEHRRIEKPARTPEQTEQLRALMAISGVEGQPIAKEEVERSVAEILAEEKQPAYSKINLKAVEQAGGPSVRDYLAMMGNIADPFVLYKLDTVKLVSENKTDWVLLAEYKDRRAPWSRNQLTIDKKTGILKKEEALIPELHVPVVILQVIDFSIKDQLDDGAFRMTIPAEGSPNAPRVSDQTERLVYMIKTYQGKK